MNIMVNPISQSQAAMLFSPDTPPCISLFLPVKDGDLKEDLNEKFSVLLAKALDYVGISYGLRQAKYLVQAPLRIPWNKLISTSANKTLAFFISPELTGFLVINDKEYKDSWKVAEHFCVPDACSICSHEFKNSEIINPSPTFIRAPPLDKEMR